MALALAALLLTACEKPDASDVTSPSARALIGTTTGNVDYAPADAPPPVTANPSGWEVRLENARFSRLENGQHSIQVVAQIKSQPGPAMEVWMTAGGQPVYRWSAGSARDYNGTVCFQLRLQNATEAMELGTGPHEMTLAFRDPGTGAVVAAQQVKVAGTVPQMKGSAPVQNSTVARDLLGCPRSVI